MLVALGSKRVQGQPRESDADRGGRAPCCHSTLARSARLMFVAFIVASLFGVAKESLGNMIRKVGEYYLGQDIASAHGLTELAPEEYALLGSSQGWFNIPGEKVFKAPDVTFNGHVWYLTIAAIDGKIYMLALQSVGPDQAAANSLFRQMHTFVRSRMGAPTEKTTTPKRYIWESSDGEVMLAQREMQGFWSVNFLLTGKRPSP